MAQRRCVNCAAPLVPDDVFCGSCGTPVAAPVRTSSVPGGSGFPAGPMTEPTAPRPSAGQAQVWPHPSGTADTAWYQQRQAEPRQAAPPQPDAFFTHAASQRGGPLSNATRYLCAAAYLDTAFANTVISELVASHRAVVPSLGIDLVPIIRHCLNARKAQLLRDLLLTVILIGGLYLATVPTIAILIFSFFLKFLPGVEWERRSIGVKLLAGGVAVVALGAVVVFYLVVTYLNSAGNTIPHLGPLATGGEIIFVALAFVALAGLTLMAYSYAMYRTFSDRLRPGAEAGQFDRHEPEVESRIAEVDAAQRGNVTIYGGENPFIGTGIVGEGWSISIELDHAEGSGEGNTWLTPKSRGYVRIDPVELHQAIRARLLKVRDDELPENERISALSVHDHVVGDGHCRWDSPVIDPVQTMPYSEASREAIEALIRHPAAGLRYYQRVCVSDEGQAVWVRQREVIGSTDQEVAVSAFIYAAVEGRTFYLEFVPVTMPPVLYQYHLVDRLPKLTSGRFMVKVFLHAASTSCRDIVGSPFRVIGMIWRTVSERRRFREEAASASDYIFADIGARISIREFRAAPGPRTFLQRLDAVKYTKIVERLVTDTVFDFLVDKGVDTSAYQDSANAIINNGVMISGNNTGAVATGHSRAEVRMQVKAATMASPKS